MFDYIKGKIVELSPAEAIVENGGFGFDIMISLQSFEALQGKAEATIYLYHYLREDDEQFYGFATKDERELFRLLIGVSGIGVGTARMMLSSLTDEEIRNAIIGESHGRSYYSPRDARFQQGEYRQSSAGNSKKEPRRKGRGSYKSSFEKVIKCSMWNNFIFQSRVA